jgi:hypothetical protein
MGFANNIIFQLKSGPPAGSVVFPTLATLSPALLNFKDVHYYNPNLPVQYAQELYLDVQREMPGGLLLDAGYVFTKGIQRNAIARGQETEPRLVLSGQLLLVQAA